MTLERWSAEPLYLNADIYAGTAVPGHRHGRLLPIHPRPQASEGHDIRLLAPFHPQTNGKLERYHQTLKRDVNQLPYELPSDLEAAIVAFVTYYNYRRYHKALGNVTPSDVLRGRREDILQRRKEIQAQTIQRRRRHNRALRELTRPPSDP